MLRISTARRILAGLLLFAVLLFGTATESLRAQVPLRLVCYNVENLFDTVSAGPHDLEFLPSASRRWTSGRYWHKLHSVAQVVAGVGQEPLPALVALCEVEGDTVLAHLTRRSALRNAGYRYVTTHSADHRGLNVALLYRPARFRLLTSHAICINSSVVDCVPTRDLLYVAGQVHGGDTLHLFVCHLPSRAGGTRQADRHRALAARTLRAAVDSLFALQPHAKVLVAGDFNAEEGDAVFTRHLRTVQALNVLNSSSRLDSMLCLTTPHEPHRGANAVNGSYRFRGEWMHLDHILVSASLLRDTLGLRCVEARSKVQALPFLLEEDATHGGKRPFRTWQGPIYRGGYSDHLPVSLDLEVGLRMVKPRIK